MTTLIGNAFDGNPIRNALVSLYPPANLYARHITRLYEYPAFLT